MRGKSDQRDSRRLEPHAVRYCQQIPPALTVGRGITLAWAILLSGEVAIGEK